MKSADSLATAAEAEVQRFIDKFDSKNQILIRAIRRVLRQRLPTANELVYDNYNFFVIGYSSTERPSDSILSIAADANGVRLAFPYTGAKLPDPDKLLTGSGSQNRALRIDDAHLIKSPPVEALIQASIDLVRSPLGATGKGKTIVRSVSAKQRPRTK